MNIVVVNWQDWTHPFAGGAEVHLREVFTRIAGSGHGVTLLCSAYPGAPREEVRDGIRIIRKGGRHSFNAVAPRLLRDTVRSRRFDVVVEDMNKIPFFLPLLTRLPVVVQIHHLFGTSVFREINAAAATYVWGMERAAVKLLRRRSVPIMVGSNSTRDELLAHGCRPEDVDVIHYGFDLGTFTPGGTKHPSPMIGYLGRLKRYKSVDHLLEAVPAVLRTFPDLTVKIVGDGDDRPRLESLSARLGLGGVVEFTGFVPERTKVDILRRMWLGVMPSVKEGWGLTVLEANGCGTPVIASRVPGLKEAVLDGETGLLYPYADREALSQAIVRMLTDAGLRARLSSAALKRASLFTWERAATETLSLLDRRLDEARRRSGRPSAPPTPGAAAGL
ncbi:MAG: glycosyl transferase group 1 [Bacteroidetes bacterium]|nr:glycosyl transferase group 1 [Bacteroidota bacterium]